MSAPSVEEQPGRGVQSQSPQHVGSISVAVFPACRSREQKCYEGSGPKDQSGVAKVR